MLLQLDYVPELAKCRSCVFFPIEAPGFSECLGHVVSPPAHVVSPLCWLSSTFNCYYCLEVRVFLNGGPELFCFFSVGYYDQRSFLKIKLKIQLLLKTKQCLKLLYCDSSLV